MIPTQSEMTAQPIKKKNGCLITALITGGVAVGVAVLAIGVCLMIGGLVLKDVEEEFFADSELSADAEPTEKRNELKLEEVRVLVTGNANTLSVGITNVTTLPVKAFRATLSRKNDFDELKIVCQIEFSSRSKFQSAIIQPAYGHLIQPKETIWYVISWYDDGREISSFSEPPGQSLPAKGEFQLEVTKVAVTTTP